MNKNINVLEKFCWKYTGNSFVFWIKLWTVRKIKLGDTVMECKAGGLILKSSINQTQTFIL